MIIQHIFVYWTSSDFNVGSKFDHWWSRHDKSTFLVKNFLLIKTTYHAPPKNAFQNCFRDWFLANFGSKLLTNCHNIICLKVLKYNLICLFSTSSELIFFSPIDDYFSHLSTENNMISYQIVWCICNIHVLYVCRGFNANRLITKVRECMFGSIYRDDSIFCSHR